MVQRLREIRVVGGGKVYGAKDGLDRRVAELKDALPSLAQLGRPTR
ncbi:MAG TPA: hypothetical protein VFP59_18160 [Candidatus Angelobacter sp.]|nr:hypothetical protein [Candidatus Angelobacter sp.]